MTYNFMTIMHLTFICPECGCSELISLDEVLASDDLFRNYTCSECKFVAMTDLMDLVERVVFLLS